jgi:hypothetical protein
MGSLRVGGFLPGNGLFSDCGKFCLNCVPNLRYFATMDPMLNIPKNRKRVPVWRLCLLMGLTALLFLMIANSYGLALPFIG